MFFASRRSTKIGSLDRKYYKFTWRRRKKKKKQYCLKLKISFKDEKKLGEIALSLDSRDFVSGTENSALLRNRIFMLLRSKKCISTIAQVAILVNCKEAIRAVPERWNVSIYQARLSRGKGMFGNDASWGNSELARGSRFVRVTSSSRRLGFAEEIAKNCK